MLAGVLDCGGEKHSKNDRIMGGGGNTVQQTISRSMGYAIMLLLPLRGKTGHPIISVPLMNCTTHRLKQGLRRMLKRCLMCEFLLLEC